MKIASLFLATLSAIAISNAAHAVQCGPNYRPNLTVVPAGATEISFSELGVTDRFKLDRSEVYFFTTTNTGSIPRMNFHISERQYPAENGQPARAESRWICSDLFSNTPPMSLSFLYVASVSPSLDGSIWSSFRNYKITWPSATRMMEAAIENDITINPYTSADLQLGQAWDSHRLYRTSDGNLMLTLSRASTGAQPWGAELRVFMKKIQ